MYELSFDGTYYIVADGLKCTDETVIIPEEYNDMPVKAIASGAFVSGENDAFCAVKIVLPKSVTEIENGAFARPIGIIEYPGAFEDWKKIRKGMMFADDGSEELQLTVICKDLSIEVNFDSEHIYGDRIILTEHSCTDNEETGICCAVCGKLISVETTRSAEHIYGSGSCIYCGKKKVSEGLEYMLNDACDGYTVIGIGTCTDTELIIPAEHNGLPVTAIGESAFSFNKAEDPDKEPFITRVHLPDSIMEIKASAFENNTSLTEIIFSSNLLFIYENAFFRTDLTRLELPESVLYVGVTAFAYNTDLSEITFRGAMAYIDVGAFEGCANNGTVEFCGTVDEWYGSGGDNAFELYMSSEPCSWIVVCTDGEIKYE